MSSYIVGYGVSASVDDPARVPSLRTDFDARNAIAGPKSVKEPCRQLDDNADDTALNPSCGSTPSLHWATASTTRCAVDLRAALTSSRPLRQLR